VAAIAASAPALSSRRLSGGTVHQTLAITGRKTFNQARTAQTSATGDRHSRKCSRYGNLAND
jgi:hypothetical protein